MATKTKAAKSPAERLEKFDSGVAAHRARLKSLKADLVNAKAAQRKANRNDVLGAVEYTDAAKTADRAAIRRLEDHIEALTAEIEDLESQRPEMVKAVQQTELDATVARLGELAGEGQTAITAVAEALHTLQNAVKQAYAAHAAYEGEFGAFAGIFRELNAVELEKRHEIGKENMIRGSVPASARFPFDPVALLAVDRLLATSPNDGSTIISRIDAVAGKVKGR